MAPLFPVAQRSRNAHMAVVTGDCAEPMMVDKMMASAFRAELQRVGLTQRAFAYITGANPRTVVRWAHGEQDIPPWVPVMLTLIKAACPIADNETPERYAARLQFFVATGGRHV